MTAKVYALLVGVNLTQASRHMFTHALSLSVAGHTGCVETADTILESTVQSFNEPGISGRDPARNRSTSLHAFHARLARFNEKRLRPAFIGKDWQTDLRDEYSVGISEGNFLEEERTNIQSLAANAPQDADAFVARWFEAARNSTAPDRAIPCFRGLPHMPPSMRCAGS